MGLAVSFPEARRVYRKYGPMLASAIWPTLSAVIALWAFLAIEFHRDPTPLVSPAFFTTYHLLLIVLAPVVVTILVGRKHNLSAGILAGGAMLFATTLLFFALGLPAGGL